MFPPSSGQFAQLAACFSFSPCLLGLLFGPEGRMDMFLRNVGFFPNYTASQLRALVVGLIMWAILLAELGLGSI
jgi:hypothetical protein